jgi:hypothetical protein
MNTTKYLLLALNSQIYRLHLTLANTWNSTWPYIHSKIKSTLQRKLQTRYKKLDTKISKLAKAQKMTPQQVHNFYPRVVNNTNIPFSEPEITLLQKGLEYNLHMKHHNWLENLALEGETAVSQLPTSDCEIYRKLAAERITTLHHNNKHIPPAPNEQHEARTTRAYSPNSETTLLSHEQTRATL